MREIIEMLYLQQELNDSTNGLNWERGVTKNGKIINWRRCIYLEASELIDSYPWKHWKDIDASADYENIKIEIVDIWHFVMSEILAIYRVENRGSIEDIASMIVNSNKFYDFNREDEHQEILDTYEAIEVVENMLKNLFCSSNIDTLVISFLEMSSKLNLKLSELYKLYIGKNILNKFRQDNGYKDGTYIKIWDNQEDNIVMQNILNSNPKIKPNELYMQLKKIYLK